MALFGPKAAEQGLLRPEEVQCGDASAETVFIPSLRPGQGASSNDLEEALLHIPIHPEDQRYLFFSYIGTVYVSELSPRVVNSASGVTGVARAVVAFLKRDGLTLFADLDDWLIISDSEAESAEHTSLGR